MIKVLLIYQTSEGLQELSLDSKLTFGRGKQVDLRFDDEGLSRLHASIYCDGERVWIIDENSTNGTFVNEVRVPSQGMVLQDGDEIRAGEHTELQIRIFSEANVARAEVVEPEQSSHQLLPIIVVSASIFLFVFVLAFIIISALTYTEKKDSSMLESYKREADRVAEFPEELPTRELSKTPQKTESTDSVNTKSNFEEEVVKEERLMSVRGRKFMEMSEVEKDAYVKEKAEKISRIIGNQVGEPIPPEAIRSIRNHLQGYINRIRSTRTDNCRQGSFTKSDTITILERASRNAPFIIRSFYAEGLDPQIGIYVAMIESEHCPCLQSPTGPLGMFQFARKTAETYGLKVRPDASPSNPDERCDPEKAARAAAKYLKYLVGRFGTGPMSFPLAIASYNSGQGGLSQNLEKALKKAADQERSFWTLVANQVVFEGAVGEQFRKENVKYVPKFFAAAIIGENPQDFGINMAPLSTYTR
ncbi:MAG: FHA domain-containing protein [Acidobacteria bacterium]|jgi:pSer/pThr/pTyr-binding forkhead associated (FHA) protein|nr:MAG: FHA domain-containing protein [Acidobacteriota bacterium]GIU81457.1 MAG: hypothetical protein KatS3mg006_0521 [Pyrinomonadaceae bacterium]